MKFGDELQARLLYLRSVGWEFSQQRYMQDVVLRIHRELKLKLKGTLTTAEETQLNNDSGPYPDWQTRMQPRLDEAFQAVYQLSLIHI